MGVFGAVGVVAFVVFVAGEPVGLPVGGLLVGLLVGFGFSDAEFFEAAGAGAVEWWACPFSDTETLT